MTYMNEGLVDRVVRIVLALALTWGAGMLWPGTASVVLFVLAAIAFITGVTGWCVLYALMDFSTNKTIA